jgi:rod shape-determining protein MreC
MYPYIPVRILNSSVNKENNHLILSKGRIHGIEPDMGVLGSEGIIGKVINVSEHFSTVMPVLHQNFVVSARLKRSGYFGNLTWDTHDATIATLHDIQDHVDVREGDTVVCRYASGIYPSGAMIGTVQNRDSDGSTGFMNIEVKLATDFRKLDYGYVVSNVHRLELDSLVNTLPVEP